MKKLSVLAAILAPMALAYDVVNYVSVYNGACRNDNMENGSDGDEYNLKSGYSFEECHEACSKKSSCEGFEYYGQQDRCELWKDNYEGYYEKKKGISCFWKTDDPFTK